MIDTNVFVSALVGDKTPLQSIEATRTGKARLLVSLPILEEMEETLSRRKFFSFFQRIGRTPHDFILNYTVLAEVVTPVRIADCPLRDPDDLKFVECALGGRASWIVSGDKDLLSLGHYERIPVLNPSQHLMRLAEDQA